MHRFSSRRVHSLSFRVGTFTINLLILLIICPKVRVFSNPATFRLPIRTSTQRNHCIPTTLSEELNIGEERSVQQLFRVG